MMDTLDLLTHRLFDYAGMFPPAALPFDEALATSAKHPETLRRPQMIDADMVVRPADLDLLTDKNLEKSGWASGRPCNTALVGVALEDAATTAQEAREFNNHHGAAATPRRIVSFEPTTPDPEAAPLATVQEQLVDAADRLGTGVRVYLEPRWTPKTWEASGRELFTRLADLSAENNIGLKVRCAGETAMTPETMVQVLQGVSEHKIPFKATQGLHHPILETKWDNSWGFLNLAAALRFKTAYGNDFPEQALLDLLCERDPAAFSFADRLRWRDHSLATQQLKTALADVPFSIGSCSIQEPDDDLHRLFPEPRE